jgi:hypothetical protein
MYKAVKYLLKYVTYPARAVDNDCPLAMTEGLGSQISQAQHFHDVVSILSETIIDQPPPLAEK